MWLFRGCGGCVDRRRGFSGAEYAFLGVDDEVEDEVGGEVDGSGLCRWESSVCESEDTLCWSWVLRGGCLGGEVAAAAAV